MQREILGENIRRLGGFYLGIVLSVPFFFLFKGAGNSEFIVHMLVAWLAFGVLAASDRRLQFPQISKYGISVWLIMHLLGGSAKVGGVRLYDLMLVNIVGEPLNIFKYDQLMHILCYFVFTFYVYAFVRGSIADGTRRGVVGAIVVLMAAGIGSINEIIELLVVIFASTSGVGNYFNNALDLIFNLIGAISSAVVILLHKPQGNARA